MFFSRYPSVRIKNRSGDIKGRSNYLADNRNNDEFMIEICVNMQVWGSIADLLPI